MERDADNMFGATGTASSTAGSTSPMGSDSIADQFSTADQAKSSAGDATGQIREKARGLQSQLADRLEQGAEKIRNRTPTTTLAGATPDGSVSVSAADRTKVQDAVARGMDKSADWLRNGDLKADIEKQVRDNPGRTLLVALGVGYLLGKTFRGGNR